MDGIDAALVDFQNGSRVIETAFLAYPDSISALLRKITNPDGQCLLDELGHLDRVLGELFAQAVNLIIRRSDLQPEQIAAIGSHGQTIRHRPPIDIAGHTPYTLQIGDPNVIVENTGITTVADFRRRDMAAGGQAAPLAPAFHAAVFARPGEPCVVVNIGGISNVTIVNRDGSVIGFDTGPGNCLIDQWSLERFSKDYDADGRIASKGRISDELLSNLLQDLFFSQPPPKSTGPEYFNLSWLNTHLSGKAYSDKDVLRTLTRLSATTIVNNILRFAQDCRAVYCCGGGVHNALLMSDIKQLLHATTVHTTDVLGINPDFVEAAAFAWLARQTLARRPGNEPNVTGAAKSVVLGGIYFP